MRRYDRISIAVDANPRQLARGREIAPIAADIMRFYGTRDGRHAVRVADGDDARARCAGGPQPGVLSHHQQRRAVLEAVLGQRSRRRLRGCRNFFSRTSSLTSGGARRSAGRTITSSGSARDSRSTSAALYAQRAHGDASFIAMLRQFRRWSLSESDQGPIDLGYRLGLIQGQGRIFRARHLQQGRVRPPHAAPLRRRRGVLQRAAPLLQ